MSHQLLKATAKILHAARLLQAEQTDFTQTESAGPQTKVVGLPKKFWIVVKPQASDELDHVAAEVTFDQFMERVKSGLGADSLLGIYKRKGDAQSVAKKALRVEKKDAKEAAEEAEDATKAAEEAQAEQAEAEEAAEDVEPTEEPEAPAESSEDGVEAVAKAVLALRAAVISATRVPSAKDIYKQYLAPNATDTRGKKYVFESDPEPDHFKLVESVLGDMGVDSESPEHEAMMEAVDEACDDAEQMWRNLDEVDL